MRHRMDDAKVFLKRDRAHSGGHEHLAPGLEVVAVFVGARKRIDNEPDALQRDTVAYRMEHRAGIAFNAVSQCVRSGSGRKSGRQAASQFGVEKDQFREQLRMEDRSEEHTSELQSRLHLVCRLLLEKKKNR